MNSVRVRTGILALLTGLIFSIGPTTVDLSLPSMPSIQGAIGTTGMRVELTLTILFLGLTLTQFLFGAIADRYGRRRTILISLFIYSVGSFVAFVSGNLILFSIGRLGQAIGFGIAAMLIRAAVVDISDERRTAAVFSTAVTMVSLTSVAAPAIGGQILIHSSWRAVFLTMSLVGLGVLIAIALGLPETLSLQRRSRAKFSSVFSTYGALLKNRRFASFAAIGACAAAFQFTYNTGGPTVVIDHYHVSVGTAGMLFSLIAVSIAVASQLNALLLKWLDPDRILSLAVMLSVVASAALLLSVFTGAGGVAGLVVSLFMLISTIGFIMGNSMAGAISAAGDQAGAASALVGVMQFLFGTIGSAVVGLIPDAAGRTMGVVVGVLSLMAVAMIMRVRQQNSPTPLVSPQSNS